MGTELVIDIKGAKNTPGAALLVNQAKKIKTPADFTAAANQLWFQAETFISGP